MQAYGETWSEEAVAKDAADDDDGRGCLRFDGGHGGSGGVAAAASSPR